MNKSQLTSFSISGFRLVLSSPIAGAISTESERKPGALKYKVPLMSPMTKSIDYKTIRSNQGVIKADVQQVNHNGIKLMNKKHAKGGRIYVG